MKLTSIARLFFVTITMLTSTAVSSQYYILGRGLDEEEKPYSFAKAELRGEGEYFEQTTTELGVFRFENLKSGTYELVLITPYGIRRKKIELRGSIDVTLHIPRSVIIDEINVVAKRAADHEPVTHENISAAELRKKDTGQDMPYLLEGSTSVVTTSDAGHGIGYTGLRIRGIDPTRINVTLNGIPVNDAESHNVFWVDLPDIASSTTDVQIQRGIGWSQPGAGDLGAGIHLNTLGFQHEPYAGAILGYGSFNSQRASLSAGSGLIKGRFTLDGRGSYIHSDGFIDRATSDLYSLYASAGYHHDQTNVRMIYALGDELTYQSWNGVPEQYVFDEEKRTFNTAGTEKKNVPYDNEVDDYQQSYYQLHVDQTLTPFARWTTALHYTRGKGYFEQYKANQHLPSYGLPSQAEFADLIRQRWLDNHFYGFTSSLQIGKPLERYLVFGGGWNRYKGEHFGNVIWTATDQFFLTPINYYLNNADKRDWNIFGRSNIKITNDLDATLDLQGRWIRYVFEGPDVNGFLTDHEVRHQFFNPKIGLLYRLSEKNSFYALTGIMNKEPNRDDYVQSTPVSRPSSEQLWDTEIGFRRVDQKFGFEMTGFYMDYKDHLVPTGQLNDVGAYARVNVGESHRAGIETSVSVQPITSLLVKGNLTVSENKIKQFDEYIDNWDTGIQEVVTHTNTDIAFSPNVIATLETEYNLFSKKTHTISVDLTGKFVGKQYVDNTSREASLLDDYAVLDAGLSWNWKTEWAKDVTLRIFLKNALDHQYESNGWIYRFRSPGFDPSDDPYVGQENGDLYHQKGYFPQAGRHLFMTLSLKF